MIQIYNKIANKQALQSLDKAVFKMYNEIIKTVLPFGITYIKFYEGTEMMICAVSKPLSQRSDVPYFVR